MKRIIALLLTAFTLLLGGCSANKTEIAPTEATEPSSAFSEKSNRAEFYKIVDNRHFIGGDEITEEQLDKISEFLQFQTSGVYYPHYIGMISSIAPITAIKKVNDEYYYNIFHYGENPRRRVALIYRNLNQLDADVPLGLECVGTLVYTNTEKASDLDGLSYKEVKKKTEKVFGKAGSRIAEAGSYFWDLGTFSYAPTYYSAHLTEGGVLILGYDENKKLMRREYADAGVLKEISDSIMFNLMLDSTN